MKKNISFHEKNSGTGFVDGKNITSYAGRNAPKGS